MAITDTNTEKQRLASNRRAICIHEAGHAVCARCLGYRTVLLAVWARKGITKGRTNFGIISTLKMLFWNHEYDSVIVQAGGIAETIFSGNSLRSPSDARHLDASGRTMEQLAGDAQRAEAIVKEHWQEILDLADILEEKGLLIFWKNL